MSKSKIAEIYYGNVGQDLIKNTPEYSELLSQVVKCEKEIRQKLTLFPELSELYEKTNELAEKLVSESVKAYYIEGFKLGLQIGIEVKSD